METVSPSAAFLVIDLQNDFCPGGNLAVPEGDQIVDVVNALMPRFRTVVATKDWHPAGHISFSSTHEGTAVFDTVEVSYGEQILWPDHCIQGSRGAELHPDLDQRYLDCILHKGVRQELDSYSAFFENDQTTPTGLDGYLRSLGCRTVYLAGLATDVCVMYSALDAVRLGYPVVLVRDASRGVNVPEGSLDSALDSLSAAGVRIVTSQEIA
jgi:nicotinamidase/pyrazinamidase